MINQFGMTEAWKIMVDLSDEWFAVANHANPNPNNTHPITGVWLDCPPGADLIDYTPPFGSNERYCRIITGGIAYNFKSWVLIKNDSLVDKAAVLKLQYTGFPQQAATFIFTSEGCASQDCYTHHETKTLNLFSGVVCSTRIPVPKNTCDPANLPPGQLPCTRGMILIARSGTGPVGPVGTLKWIEVQKTPEESCPWQI